jgi:hypothetical protein
LGRRFIGIEIAGEHVAEAEARIEKWQRAREGTAVAKAG